MKTITNVFYPTLAMFALACCALAPTAQAVIPAPDGGYPGNNTAEGTNALFSLTTGVANTATGSSSLSQNTSASYNTATGFQALVFDTTGGFNTATGAQALSNNKTGINNTAAGYQALFHNTDVVNTSTGVVTKGQYNTATGSRALFSNKTGNANTADGYQALFHNTEIVNPSTGDVTKGEGNTAAGYQALFTNTTASGNTAAGYQALYRTTTGPGNGGYGYQALFSNTVGSGNTASGSAALQANTSSNSNTAIGRLALASNTSGDHNIALGQNAGENVTTGNSNIDIGNSGVAGDNGTIRVGDNQHDAFIAGLAHFSNSATFIAGIRTINQGQPSSVVYINTNTGRLDTVAPPSSRRFKKEIRPMDQTSEAILGLKPVTFHYKSDSTDTPQFGLIAEEVAQVNPDLVVRDENGGIYTVRYEAVNAMLLNEFLKAHRRIEEQDKRIDQLRAQLKEQALLIQKVSDKVELSRPAPQIVLDSR